MRRPTRGDDFSTWSREELEEWRAELLAAKMVDEAESIRLLIVDMED